MKKIILLILLIQLILFLQLVSAWSWTATNSISDNTEIKEGLVNYKFEWGETNFSLYKGEELITDLDLNVEGDKIKFSGTDSALAGDEQAVYTYFIKSNDELKIHVKTLRVAGNRTLDPMAMPPFPDDPIWDEIGYTYSWPIVYNIQKNAWDDKKEIYDFQDICKEKYSKCSWEVVKGGVEVSFVSEKSIDPAIESVSGCGDLNIPGQLYEMNHSVTNDFIGLPEQSWFGANCINIVAPNIILDCKGYKINETANNNVWDHAGIYSNSTNTTIRNCDVTTRKVGNRSMGASLGTLMFPGGWGIVLKDANNSHVYNNVIDDQDFGIALMSTSNSLIENNTMLRNLFAGLVVGNWITSDEGSINNTFKDNNISEYDEYYPTEKNQYQAVNIYLGAGNVFINNEISRGDFRVHLAKIIINGILRFTDSEQLFEIEDSDSEVNITSGGEIKGV